MQCLALLFLVAVVTISGAAPQDAPPPFWWLTGPAAPPEGNPSLGALVEGHHGGSFAALQGLQSQHQLHDGNCQCVPYYQCSDTNDVITDGAGIIDIRNINGTALTKKIEIHTNSRCARFLDVCCTNPNTNIKPIEGTMESYQPGCGKWNPTGVIARVGGFSAHQAQFAEFPYVVAILKLEQIGNEVVKLYLCAGSLVAPNIILTAAHCVDAFHKNPEDLVVRLGEWDTQKEYEPLAHVDIPARTIVVHKGFNSQNLVNDFALIELHYQAPLAHHIDTLCLPESENDYDYNQCFVAGWGKDKFGNKGEYQNILKKVKLPIVPNNVCQEKLRHTRLGPFFTLHHTFACAGGDRLGNDACKGDGGAPLMCRHRTDTRYVQVGIVAWGIGCGDVDVPGVYANVVSRIKWINKNIRQLSSFHRL